MQHNRFLLHLTKNRYAMKRIFYLLVCILLTGCSDPKQATLDDEHDSRALTGDLIMNLRETYPYEQHPYANKGVTGMYIDIRTEKIYAYSGNSIENRVSTAGNVLTLELGKVLLTGMMPATGPATVVVDLPENIDKLIVERANRKDEYGIKIADDGVRIVPAGNTFTQFEHSLYLRRPENTFALIAGTYTDNTNLYYEFLDKLFSGIPSLEEFHFPEEGHLPWPVKSDGHYIDFPTKFFTYSDPSDFEEAGKILYEFAATRIVSPDSGVGFWLSNFDNRQYMSWMVLR